MVTCLMVAFTSYIIYIIMFNAQLPCTCGGMLEMLSWPQHLAFNITFILLGIIAIILLRKQNGSSTVKIA